MDFFIKGDKVEIIGGPLKGLRGIVVRIKGENQFILKIDAIQQAVSCQIKNRYLKLINVKNAN